MGGSPFPWRFPATVALSVARGTIRTPQFSSLIHSAYTCVNRRRSNAIRKTFESSCNSAHARVTRFGIVACLDFRCEKLSMIDNMDNLPRTHFAEAEVCEGGS